MRGGTVSGPIACLGLLVGLGCGPVLIPLPPPSPLAGESGPPLLRNQAQVEAGTSALAGSTILYNTVSGPLQARLGLGMGSNIELSVSGQGLGTAQGGGVEATLFPIQGTQGWLGAGLGFAVETVSPTEPAQISLIPSLHLQGGAQLLDRVSLGVLLRGTRSTALGLAGGRLSGQSATWYWLEGGAGVIVTIEGPVFAGLWGGAIWTPGFPWAYASLSLGARWSL